MGKTQNTDLSNRYDIIKHRRDLTKSSRSILSHSNNFKAISECGHKVNGSFVKIYRNYDTGKAVVDGVHTCKSVWSCPFCSAKISEKRRLLLKKGMQTFKDDQAGTFLLLTLTAPHQLNDSLKSLRKRLKAARVKFLNHRGVKSIYYRSGIVGNVNATELTYSKINGWHLHFHDLLFVSQGHDLESISKMQNDLYGFWADCCVVSGLGMPLPGVGLDLRAGDYANYISKWGLDFEITKANVKQSSGSNSWTMFQLLYEYSINQGSLFFNLFLEFSTEMKGCRQLVYSRGLKRIIGIDGVDVSLLNEDSDNIVFIDNSYLENQKKRLELVISISARQWYLLCIKDLLVDLLYLAETRDSIACDVFMSKLE